MPQAPKDLRDIQSLVQIVADLRGPEGCPWDKEQTHISLVPYAVEETFELAEALEGQEDKKIKEELGDVLFQVVLHSQLAEERKGFDLADVIESISSKIVRRHPHVFENEKVAGSAEVLANWETLKKKEKGIDSDPFKLDVPAGLPALQRAAKIGFRTNKLKFDWQNAEKVWEKVHEEFDELQEALDSDSDDAIRHELGDLLFSLAQLARHLEMDPEQVAREANRRFELRFKKMMEIRHQKNLDWSTLADDEKEKLWQQAKKETKGL